MFFLGVSEEYKAYKVFNPLTKKVVTSKDVVFDEENTWDWNIPQYTPILINNEVEEAVKTPEISTEAADETSPSILEETAATNQPLRRARRRPLWMMDYEVRGINVNEDVSKFALFTDCDPTAFENAVKEEKWREAEIDAIE